MAIEIIKHGNIKPDDEFVVQCIRCENVFTFKRLDADGKNHESITCPDCGQILNRHLWSQNIDWYKSVVQEPS